MKTTQIDNRWISLTEVDQIINENYQLVLADNALAAIQKCRTYLDEKVAKNFTDSPFPLLNKITKPVSKYMQTPEDSQNLSNNPIK